ADPRRLVARGLPPDEDAVADEVPALARHAVVVPTDGREPARLRAVGDEVDELAAEAEPARVVRAEEARPGEVRLEPHRAIELRGMADALVDREPEVARREDHLARARLHAAGVELLLGLQRERSRDPGEV